MKFEKNRGLFLHNLKIYKIMTQSSQFCVSNNFQDLTEPMVRKKLWF